MWPLCGLSIDPLLNDRHRLALHSIERLPGRRRCDDERAVFDAHETFGHHLIEKMEKSVEVAGDVEQATAQIARVECATEQEIQAR